MLFRLLYTHTSNTAKPSRHQNTRKHKRTAPHRLLQSCMPTTTLSPLKREGVASKGPQNTQNQPVKTEAAHISNSATFITATIRRERKLNQSAHKNQSGKKGMITSAAPLYSQQLQLQTTRPEAPRCGGRGGGERNRLGCDEEGRWIS